MDDEGNVIKDDEGNEVDLSKIDGEDTPSVVAPVKEVPTTETVEETEELEEVDEIETPVYTDGDEE